VRFVYLVRKSTLYNRPVPLSSLGITKIQYGHKLTEDEFQDLQKLAAGTEEYHNFQSLPQSAAELEYVLREVRRRLGQSDFRMALISAYNARCAVSGCNAVEALEAAHITPYTGEESNDPSNGLLLRADIHTLFDLNLLGIDPQSLTVVLGAALEKTSYRDLQGKQIVLPADPTVRPSANALAERWQQFLTRPTKAM
jgi:predicted restriction endonuclease